MTWRDSRHGVRSKGCGEKNEATPATESQIKASSVSDKMGPSCFTSIKLALAKGCCKTQGSQP
jgi:hypothetical protein